MRRALARSPKSSLPRRRPRWARAFEVLALSAPPLLAAPPNSLAVASCSALQGALPRSTLFSFAAKPCLPCSESVTGQQTHFGPSLGRSGLAAHQIGRFLFGCAGVSRSALLLLHPDGGTVRPIW
jgi:hypothetical protein